MQVITPGHKYILENFESGGGQTLQFIHKEPINVNSPELTIIVNWGTTNEEVIKVLIDRMQFLQGIMSCKQNADAIYHLDQALKYLEERTLLRKEAGIEGTCMNIAEPEQQVQPPPTLGEYRVGISFNPGGHKDVDDVKRLAANLIDRISNIRVDEVQDIPEIGRCKAEAMTCIETGAMWAVKAATKPPRINT